MRILGKILDVGELKVEEARKISVRRIASVPEDQHQKLSTPDRPHTLPLHL